MRQDSGPMWILQCRIHVGHKLSRPRIAPVSLTARGSHRWVYCLHNFYIFIINQYPLGISHKHTWSITFYPRFEKLSPPFTHSLCQQLCMHTGYLQWIWKWSLVPVPECNFTKGVFLLVEQLSEALLGVYHRESLSAETASSASFDVIAVLTVLRMLTLNCK